MNNSVKDMYSFKIEEIDNCKTATLQLQKAEQGGSQAMEFTHVVNQCLDEGAQKIVLDFAKVEIMNSTGLGMLVGTLSNLKTKKIPLELHQLSERILNIIKSTKLDKVFVIK